MTAAVIVAAGRGERLEGDVPKQFRDLGGVPILAWSVLAFEAHPGVDRLVTVLGADAAGDAPDWLSARTDVVAGGATRAESVARGVAAAGAADILLIHDGVRPFVSSGLISRVLEAAGEAPTIPVVPVSDTVKIVDADGWVEATPDRSTLRAAQTPQGFPGPVLRGLHGRTEPEAAHTDEGVLCERHGVAVRTVPGDEANLKITTPVDLDRARWLVESGVMSPPILK